MVLKWGGSLTDVGLEQASLLGTRFRGELFPGRPKAVSSRGHVYGSAVRIVCGCVVVECGCVVSSTHSVRLCGRGVLRCGAPQAIRIAFSAFTIPISMISRSTHRTKGAFRPLPARLPLSFNRFVCLVRDVCVPCVCLACAYCDWDVGRS